ncbi:MAG: hypothetical protein WDW36_007043 [Sanguina aurantia]
MQTRPAQTGARKEVVKVVVVRGSGGRHVALQVMDVSVGLTFGDGQGSTKAAGTGDAAEQCEVRRCSQQQAIDVRAYH